MLLMFDVVLGAAGGAAAFVEYRGVFVCRVRIPVHGRFRAVFA